MTPAPRRGGAFLAALAGGALAAVAGFALSHYDILGLRPAPAPDRAAELAAVNARLDGLAGTLAKVEGQVGEASARAKTAIEAAQTAAVATTPAPPALGPIEERLAALESALTDRGDNAALPGPVDTDAIRAMIDEELAARDKAAEAEDKATADAAAMAAQAEATRTAALQSLRDALSSGAPYSTALAALSLPQVPEALARHAEAGLPTLAALTEAFPDAARNALAASLRAGGKEEGIADQIWSFLRAETGARSLTPQEGDDPDAVLSRAEAAVAAGDLAAALGELAALPPAGSEAMAAWAALAQDRLAAEAALAGLDAPTPAPDTSASP